MPSLFFPKSAAPTSDLDEFGRVATPFSSKHNTPPRGSTSAQRQRLRPKRTRRREGNHGLRQNHPKSRRTLSRWNLPPAEPRASQVRDRRASTTPAPPQHDYGYLSYERHVVLGLDELERLLDVVADELETRGGITTPFNQQEAQVADLKWREEARFVGPHELGMTLRWALARVIRSVGANHFQTTFLPSLPPTLHSGHTPPTLSPLFGPLFFGLGPATLAFHHAYLHYLRSVNAFEHLLLAFVRWQDTPRSATAAQPLGGYPSMLPFTNPKAKPQPRKGARTVRVMSVRRNVRMYSPDLVKSGSSWAHKVSPTLMNSFATSKEWERISPTTLKLPPRYSDPYKKKMNLANNFHPDVDPRTYPAANSPPLGGDSDYFATEERKDARFRSLTDLKWGEFESMGFDNLGDDKKLQFDLTESARQERAAKRQTLSWNDFSAAGFSRMDAPLSTLQFSTPLINTMHKKLKKQAKALPSFGWDTEPVVGNEEVIEEAFIDVFCDLVYGGGWMDLERGESLDRDCNWALVEYKSLPPARSTASGGSDPRTDTTLILYENSRRRLPSLFSTSSRKQWKQAATLNGRPTPGYRELEFEGLLQGASGTKVLSLSAKRDSMKVPPKFNTMNSSKAQPDIPRLAPPRQLPPAMSGSPVVALQRNTPLINDEMPSDSSATPSGHKKSRFRLPVNDDEPEDVKQKRRESRPDAWVDILVGSQSRRMDDQTRRRARMRKSDPDMASTGEVALAAEYPDMLSERSHRHIYEDSDVDLVEKSSEDDELMAPILNARYFDLHPELEQQEEDPRDRFARDSMSEEGIDDDDDINTPTHPPEPRRPLPPPPLVTIAPLTPSKSPSPPAARVVPDIKIVTEAPPTPEKPKLSPPNTNGHANANWRVTTAALIEMYREKERGTTASPAAIHVPTIPVAPLNISRIPVRNASLPAPPAPPAPAASLPSLPVAPLTPSPSPSPKPSPPQPTDFVPPPSIDDPSLGRASPARYVHGAPLHNVLEEEEEEE
ncbi:hypothetical protein BKA70DRAFT_1388193 [Coprinopsis sp. MPI-PUGE-AT-0042]|nr:hypothetical protein BKA70DRAFT_1388193 [Coprinopsis sp. MPI-PUGE-AT-0042]